MDIYALNEEFRYAKEHPFKVRLEFDHRFRVWKDIIHRNRRLHLLAADTPKNMRSLHQRYYNLDMADAARLERRATKEYIYAVEDRDYRSLAAIAIRMVYVHRLRQIPIQLEYQLSKYEQIIDESIIPRATVRIRELKELKEA